MKDRIKSLMQFHTEDVKIELRKEKAILQALASDKPLVSYIGWTGHDNLGDEILYEAHQALFPRLRFVPFRQPAAAEAVRRLQHKPLYVAGFLGGGTLINQSPAWIRKIMYLENKGLPVYCFGTGVTEDTFRMAFEKTSLGEWVEVLRTFPFAGIRGPRSMQLLKAAGFDGAQQIGDTALALAPAVPKPRPQTKVIGFNYGLIKENQIWGDADQYTDNIVKTIQALIADGYEVRLLPVWDRDIESNQRLMERVGDPRCTMRLCFDSLEHYVRELDACQLFIGQKLHATIMACMERIPSIMIEYQPKCRDFMASVGMESKVIKTSECTPEALLAMVAGLRKDARRISAELDRHVTHYRSLQYELARGIEDDLLARAGAKNR